MRALVLLGDAVLRLYLTHPLMTRLFATKVRLRGLEVASKLYFVSLAAYRLRILVHLVSSGRMDIRSRCVAARPSRAVGTTAPNAATFLANRSGAKVAAPDGARHIIKKTSKRAVSA